MVKLIIAKEMKRRILDNEVKLENLKKEKVILSKAKKEKADKALIPVDAWASLQVNGEDVSNQFNRVEENIKNTTAIISRYKKDTASFEKNGTVSDKTKEVLINHYEFLKTNNTILLTGIKNTIEGISVAHRHSKVNSEGMYYFEGRSISPNYYNEWIEKENTSMVKFEERLERIVNVLDYLNK